MKTLVSPTCRDKQLSTKGGGLRFGKMDETI